jgi:flagellar biosynthesis/type III secretory pathway chaperone
MTQEEIIELALKVDLMGHELAYSDWYKNRLKAFGKLVAEKVNADWSETNERLIKVFNEKADLAYLSGAKEEREACAKVCEEYETNNDIADTWLNIVSEVIRARGQA